jgi:hypothetical protein
MSWLFETPRSVAGRASHVKASPRDALLLLTLAAVPASFAGAWLLGVDLTAVDLRWSKPSEANLCGADRSALVGLTQDQNDSDIGDARTQIPESLTRPEHLSQ